jgi:rhamnose transport system substrate-binding protein
MNNRRSLRIAACLLALIGLSACTRASAPETAPLRLGIVAKSLGNGFFDAVHKGADEAATELGVSVIFTGPPTPTAEGQIEVINSLIAQRVDAIAVSANDPDALVPSLQKAMQRGIKVISFDSAVGSKGRALHLSPSSDELIGQTCAQLASSAAGGKGAIAVVSATPTSTNQNLWLAQLRSALADHPDLTLVDVVYGDDVSDKSYRETIGLLKRHPDLRAIVSLSSVGIVAAAKAVEDQGQSGKIKVTGLGLPSELAGYVRSGVVPEFAIWNPIDLGYATTQVAVALVRTNQEATAASINAGRMGSIAFDRDGIGAMAKPFIYNLANIEQFAAVF